ncbi:MAG TPA: nucleoporin [Pyrinomonadaceae bacterium]|nr:nucleoporin [Pyrinomonadaceae bacterium]
MKPKEDRLKEAAGYKWEVDTNNKMTALLNAAHEQGELQGMKPIYNGAIIEMVTTKEIDEWDDDADQQIETLVGQMASEAKQLERAIKFQPGQMRAIDLPGMPKAHIGFDTTHQPLIDHVNATAYVQATVAARIDRVEELMEVAKALDSPHALDAQRRTTILSEAPLNATKILNDLQDIHAGWLEQSTATPKQTVSPTPITSGFTFGSTPSSDTSQSTGGFTFGNSNVTGSGGFTAPQSTSGGFSFGGFTPQPGSSGGFTFGNSNSSSSSGFTFGNSNSASSSGFLAPSIPFSGFTPPSSSNIQFGVSSWQDSHLDTLKSIPDVRQLSDLRGFLSVLSLVVLGSRTYTGTQVKNQSPLFNKCDLTKVRSSSLSSKSQAVLSRYADSIINLVLGVNGVDAEENFERDNIMASVGQVVKSIVKGNSDAMFTLIAMGNDLKELQPERVGAKWLGQSNRPQSPVFEFRSIAGRPSPDQWVSLAKRIKDNVKAINQPKFQTRLEEDSFKRRTYPW